MALSIYHGRRISGHIGFDRPLEHLRPRQGTSDLDGALPNGWSSSRYPERTDTCNAQPDESAKAGNRGASHLQ